MISEKDLRIGNLLIEKFTKEIIKVESLNSDGVICFSGNFKGDWQAELIPLTEEWLLKFGFEKSVSKSFIGLYIKEFAIKLSYNIETNQFWCNDCKSHIKHVHQLQNLYFALTGEELGI